MKPQRRGILYNKLSRTKYFLIPNLVRNHLFWDVRINLGFSLRQHLKRGKWIPINGRKHHEAAAER